MGINTAVTRRNKVMLKAAPVKIGPKDHGRRMSLEEFEPAQVKEGHIYELSRGVIVVSDVPDFPHMRHVAATRDQFVVYKLANPDQLYEVLGSMDCKLLIPRWESERHPDLAIYKKPPKLGKGFWYRWIPDIVIEVVSARSSYRDYVEKRQEYLTLGAKEYWIINGQQEEVMILRRFRAKWAEEIIVQPGQIYETKLLPGFQFDCQRVFDAANG